MPFGLRKAKRVNDCANIEWHSGGIYSLNIKRHTIHIKHKYPLVLTINWTERIFKASKDVEGTRTTLGDVKLSQNLFVEDASKQYNDFVCWEVAYLQGETLVKTGLTYEGYSWFKLSDLNNADNLDLYEKAIENNNEIYFIAKRQEVL